MDGYVDLALSSEEIEQQRSLNTPMADLPKYPWGTELRLDEKILEKMGVDHSDWDVGDIFHLHALAKVTSKSENESQQGANCCVTLQLIALKGESEDAEDKTEESNEPDLKPHGYLRYKT